MAEVGSFSKAWERRHPGESYLTHLTLNELAAEQNQPETIDSPDHAGRSYKTFYLKDLGKRMVAALKSKDVIGQPLMQEYDRLEPTDQERLVQLLKAKENK